MTNNKNSALVLAWIACWSLAILVIGISGRVGTAQAETMETVEIIDVSMLEVAEPNNNEVISPPVEFHVTPTSFYMVETTGEPETYMVGDTRIDTEPGTLTLYN